MPTCDLCGEDTPVVREDEARAWELCTECWRLNTPREPRPERTTVRPQEAAACLDAALLAWAQRVGVVLVEGDDHA